MCKSVVINVITQLLQGIGMDNLIGVFNQKAGEVRNWTISVPFLLLLSLNSFWMITRPTKIFIIRPPQDPCIGIGQGKKMVIFPIPLCGGNIIILM